MGSTTKRNKNKQTEFVFKTKSKRDMVLQKSQIKENLSSTNTEEELERKIDSITTGLSRPYFNKILKELAKKNLGNAIVICDYIIAEQIEINIQNSTKESKIKVLRWLTNHFQDNKSFRNMTKHDILDFLNKLRKSTIEDPANKWIGSYNGRQIILTKFFRWLYNSDEPDHRNRTTPSCMQGIKRLPRKEKTSYKPADIWESREHILFLKYCPTVRDRCYHAIANDMSARPNEILNLKIKDIKFHVNDEGVQFAEVRITGGKTGYRTVPLIDSLPYAKEWLREHPTNSNPDSWIFVSQGNNHGSKLTYEGLSSHYEYYKKRYFPSLLIDKTIPDYDKELIKNMLTKPWNLYVFRHSALTEKSQFLTEAVLRSHAGWTMSSKMPQVYIHLSNEPSKILLQKRGIIRTEDRETPSLQSKRCANCNEPNKPDSRFCFKCKMVLTFDSYKETLEREKEKESELQIMKQQIQMLTESQKEILECLKYPERLTQIINGEK